MMQLDDVVDSTHSDLNRFEEARHRSEMAGMLPRGVTNPEKQNLPHCTGGLDEEKRIDCADKLTRRNVTGFAIRGLSGRG